MSDRVWLEVARLEDLDRLVTLERASFTHPWTTAHFRDEMADTSRGRILVLREPFAAGDAARGLVAYCVYWLVLDELHVNSLAVEPARRGRGLGRRLLRQVLGIARARGARTALLEVRQSNWPALQLYRSLGFRMVSVRRDYYDRPREDAILLEKPDLGTEP